MKFQREKNQKVVHLFNLFVDTRATANAEHKSLLKSVTLTEFLVIIRLIVYNINAVYSNILRVQHGIVE